MTLEGPPVSEIDRHADVRGDHEDEEQRQRDVPDAPDAKEALGRPEEPNLSPQLNQPAVGTGELLVLISHGKDVSQAIRNSWANRSRSTATVSP